jgi:hypothetical protein
VTQEFDALNGIAPAVMTTTPGSTLVDVIAAEGVVPRSQAELTHESATTESATVARPRIMINLHCIAHLCAQTSTAPGRDYANPAPEICNNRTVSARRRCGKE